MTPLSATAPSSTYRLQITDRFTLEDAVHIVGYLHKLGVGAIYVSPLLQASNGSQHGYDVVNHLAVDVARGGAKGLQALSEAAQRAGLRLVVDIVPNHMGVADPIQNQAWWDLLRNGPDAESDAWFDVDWLAGGGRVLIPILGDNFDADHDLTIEGDELHYFDHRYPLAPGTQREGDSASAVHNRQHYELVSFRRADTDQNYRRFFAVTDLAGLRVENPQIHDATHQEILRWVAKYGVTGLRVDHPDGLADPRAYLERLAKSAPGCWITVEKITQVGEALSSHWPVDGMTGYDALAEITAVFVDPRSEEALSRIYLDLTGDDATWNEHVRAGKRFVATTILRAEVRRLARLVPSVEAAEHALTELLVAFPVYRSYLPEGAEHLAQATATASGRNPELAASLAALMPRLSDHSDELCIRFQQLTGAVMAKGVEDTAFYRYTRLLGLNEVGASPGQFGLDIAAFHAAQTRRDAKAAGGMTTLSTHDTKRGEDLRARLAVLSELPAQWADTARRLRDLVPISNRSFGYLLWQTFVATGLIERERMHAFAEKAMREASTTTNWAHPVEGFETEVHTAIDLAYDRAEVRAVIEAFADRITEFGWSNSLAQKLVQLTMPGVPDVYEGSEFYEGSLVDPDNRRPINFVELEAHLDVLDLARRGPAGFETPLAKLWVTRRALAARRDHPELFSGYRPLILRGPKNQHLLAFDRGGAITLVTRLPVGLRQSGGWGDAHVALSGRIYRDALTGILYEGDVALDQLFRQYPVALLLASAAS
jgi:(1->4)-alpha-D-glucan 1-alpha-D-glucosylmutase